MTEGSKALNPVATTIAPTSYSSMRSCWVKSKAFRSPQASTQVCLHLPRVSLQAGLGIDHGDGRHGLREGDPDGLAQAQPLIEGLGNLALVKTQPSMHIMQPTHRLSSM